MRAFFILIPLLAALSGCINYDPSATAVARDLRRYVKPGFTKDDALCRFGAPLAMTPIGFCNRPVERWSYVEGLNSWEFDFDKNGVLADWRTNGAAAIGFSRSAADSEADSDDAREALREIKDMRNDLKSRR